MKKIAILATIALSMSLSSCSDFLQEDNPNSIPTTSYFSLESDVETAVLGIYGQIRNSYCMGESSFAYTEERSDNAGRTDNQSSSGEPFQFTDFSLSPTNTYLKSHWTALYTAVSRANYVLTYMDNVVYADDANKVNHRAEALFARAYVYFHLVRKWGDVPLITKYTDIYDEIVASTKRDPKEEVYAQIVADLTEALNCTLPDIQLTTGKGRACKVAINALLGQVYLTMGCVFDTDNISNFTNAKKYLEAAYAMRSFGSLTEINYEDVFDVDQKNTNAEIIYQVVYIQGDVTYSSSNARTNQSTGVSINSQYPSSGSGRNVMLDLVKEYEEGDVRFDYSLYYVEDRSEWNNTKFRDASDAAGTNGYGGNDYILMRYADVMLMLAEAEMYLGNDANAIEILDEVRERAGLPSYAESMQNSDYATAYTTLKLAILHERRVELAFENQRLFDLLRAFDETEFPAFFKAKDQNNYSNSSLANCGSKDIYYPIPFDEVKLNSELMYQNPGY